MIIQLVQINQPFLQRDYLPYTIGLLQAYVMRHACEPWRYTFMPPMFQRQPLEQALSALQLAQIIGFSVYTWNIHYSLELAARIKAIRPDCLVIFGGPQVPDQAEAFLRKHPFIDVVCHGEGEEIFLKLLEALPAGQLAAQAEKNWENVPGISWINAQGQFQTRPRPARIKDLDQIPSPYLLNVFAPLLRERPADQWIALWETNRGCPFSCSFCDWGSATASKVNRFGLERLKAEIQWFGQTGIHLVYCCDANYGLLSRDLEITEAMVASKQRYGSPKAFYIQNTKNVTERAYQIQKMIANSGLNQAVTLSLQSTTPEVLANIQRENISLASYHELQKRFREDGVATYTDILVGLPGETFNSFAACIERVIEEGQHHLVRFYNVALLPNAEMAQPEYRQRHQLQTVTLNYVAPFTPTYQDWPETQEIVIATATLSLTDWVRCRALAWWVEFVYFNRKLLQVPIVLLRRAGIPYAEIFSYLLEGNWPQTSVLAQIKNFMLDKARRVQAGEEELCAAQVPGKGELWLSVEEYLFMGLNQSQAWSVFFTDVQLIFEKLLADKQLQLPLGVLSEAMLISAKLLNVIQQDQAFEQPVSSNFWQVYQSQLRNQTLDWKPWRGELLRDWKGQPFHSLKLRDVTMPSTQERVSF